uniref:Uncharacterized protein n=1 Tax=Lactuca sativa TaxID=4236 RepID=A0A9R1VJV2_LACSA|nr:hypothetical protein LSAT_V11C500264430 [Lactuca sativa]
MYDTRRMPAYGVPPLIYYHFLMHGGDFHFGLKPLGNDDDLRTFAQYVRDHKIMRVYTEHGKTKLHTYFMNPKPVTKVTIVQMDEIDDNENPTVEVQDLPVPFTSSPVEVQPLHVEVHDRQKELIANDFIQAATKFDIGLYQKILQSNADVGQHVQVEVEEHVEDEVEEQAQVEVEENAKDKVELEHGHEDAMEDHLDNYMETEIEGNIENEHDNRSISDRGEGSHYDEEDDSEDSEDNDWVDEENIIPEVEVDMRDFHMTVDTEAYFF